MLASARKSKLLYSWKSAYPPVTLMWRLSAGRAWRRSMMKSCPLGLRAIASVIACSSSVLFSEARTGGPARYVRVKETGGRLGFITPLTHNFCEACNRVRLTCTGKLYMCLGQEDAADLRAPMRASDGNERLNQAIEDAIARKPKGHDFVIDRRRNRPAVGRHMSVTGG